MLETTSARHDERVATVEKAMSRANMIGAAILISIIIQIASSFVNV
jgi:hypothetical protein